jgi:hypothetical protein
MPAQPSWLLQLPQIQEELDAITAPVIDRSCIEKLFRVRRRRAIDLMHEFGGFLSGKTFLVEKGSVKRSLERIAEKGYEFELGRRTRLVGELERVRKLLPARKVRLQVPAAATENRMTDLPPGVHLRAGELRIEFHGTEDLLRHLFELSQAIVNDYKRFEEVCESGG